MLVVLNILGYAFLLVISSIFYVFFFVVVKAVAGKKLQQRKMMLIAFVLTLIYTGWSVAKPNSTATFEGSIERFIGVIVVFAIHYRITMYKKCPYCAEKIKKEAVKCKYCQAVMNSHEG